MRDFHPQKSSDLSERHSHHHDASTHSEFSRSLSGYRGKEAIHRSCRPTLETSSSSEPYRHGLLDLRTSTPSY